MNTLHVKTTMLVFLIFISCSTIEEPVEQTTTTTSDNSVLMELANLSWTLDACPTNSSLNIEGFTECAYLNYISFSEDYVFIRHGNNPYFTKHNICFVDGNNLVISRQGCGFTEWTGIVELEIVSYDNDNLEMMVRFPNLSVGYNERYAYEDA